MRRPAVQFLSAEALELTNGADNNANLTLFRNGVIMAQGEDYNVGDGDLNRFISRFRNLPPWTPKDQFTAAIDE